VVVTIPWLLSYARGEAFLEEKMSWVLKARLRIEKRGLKKKLLQPGILFSTRNYKYLISPQKTEKITVKLQSADQVVEIAYPETASLEHPEVRKKLKMAIEGVLRYEAKRYLPLRIKELAQLLGYKYKAVTIKNNKTNWGSCSSLKNINLNLHLMRLPDRAIDLIIVHELVHTQIPNHGPLFKERMKLHFPDEAELNREVKKIRPDLF
jgi:predicted metal-dependent hydrolase